MAWDLLENLDNTREVIDVRRDKKFQEFDVDFLWKRQDCQIFWVEVKTDTQINKTQNVVYELTTSNNIGCFEKTKSDLIMYFDSVSHTMYALHTKKLQNKAKTSLKQPIRMGDNATGYLFSIEELKKDKIIFKIWTNIA